MRFSVPALRLPLAAILAVWSLLLLAAPLQAKDQDLSDADREAIHSVIDRQLTAFLHDDAEAAFALNSPSIQREFGTPEIFMQMVQNGYPAVYRPRSKSFGDIKTVRGAFVQQVNLIGPNGDGQHAYYVMEHEPDGSWRINGVATTPSDDIQI
jgi:Domain of unknown function (DUF4864)